MSTIDKAATVGQLMVEQPGRSSVFERWGLDYCCGGRKPLNQACLEKGISLEAVVADLEGVTSTSSAFPEPDWNEVPLSVLADHIVNTHHAYVRWSMPRLSAIIEKVCNAHGQRFDHLYEVREIFAVLRAEFEAHIAKEEMVLFPLIKQLEEMRELGVTSHIPSVRYPIAAMESEHETTGSALEDIRRLTANFTRPSGACNTYLAMLDGLNALETDTHRHVHKENNILFVRAIDLELAGSSATLQ